jgi:hypothetical protein
MDRSNDRSLIGYSRRYRANGPTTVPPHDASWGTKLPFREVRYPVAIGGESERRPDSPIWSRLAQQRQWLCTAAMIFLPVSAPINVLV